jgi:hypothetical protein
LDIEYPTPVSLRASLKTQIFFLIEGDWRGNYFISISILFNPEGDLRFPK